MHFGFCSTTPFKYPSWTSNVQITSGESCIWKAHQQRDCYCDIPLWWDPWRFSPHVEVQTSVWGQCGKRLLLALRERDRNGERRRDAHTDEDDAERVCMTQVHTDADQALVCRGGDGHPFTCTQSLWCSALNGESLVALHTKSCWRIIDVVQAVRIIINHFFIQ